MENSINELFSLSFICLCLAIAAITEILRRVAEFILDKPQVPASKTSKVWTDLLLPLAPFANGILFTLLIKQYPYPEGWHSTGSRFIIGLVAGSLSGLVYRIVKAFAKDKLDQYKKSKSTPPPADSAQS